MGLIMGTCGFVPGVHCQATSENGKPELDPLEGSATRYLLDRALVALPLQNSW